MKYFDNLNEVETQIIRLGEMNRLLRVLSNGAESSSQEDLVSSIQYLEGSIDDISTQLAHKFQHLFDELKDIE